MSLHDRYARVTPFEIAFPDEGEVERLVREVTEEASSRGVDLQLPGVFATLGAVGDFVSALRPPDAPAEAVQELGALLFHAVHFVRAERPVYLLETAATRYLAEGAPAGRPRPPRSAGYLQLPQHLFWVDDSYGGTPESVDGIFWFASQVRTLHVLPITGVLPASMAFRALPLPEAPLGDADEWLGSQVREETQDYSSALPGHDVDGLYSVETAGEVLKLLARFFAYLEAVPTAAEPTAHMEGEADGPRPSRLPYTRVRLVA